MTSPKKIAAVAIAALLCVAPAFAAEEEGPHQAAGFDIFGSSDADHFQVLKTGISYFPEYENTQNYLGARLEHFLFSSDTGGSGHAERGFANFAGSTDDWNWGGTAGTDGRTLLGSVNAFTQGTIRQEYFVNRDLVETPLGFNRGIYFTFFGGSYDIPLDDRNTVTALVGAQTFSGKNYRLHLRSTYVYVLDPDWGLSLQFRAKYFWDSQPREFDYFSPRWYMEGIPTLQMRRFYDRWQFLVAAGYGARRNNGATWQGAGLAQVSVISPRFGSNWVIDASFLYSNQPIAASYAYTYEQATVSLIRRF
ncbi:MAG TPA: hypothetical protein VGI89_09205 [Rhizomicrobium sp.]